MYPSQVHFTSPGSTPLSNSHQLVVSHTVPHHALHASKQVNPNGLIITTCAYVFTGAYAPRAWSVAARAAHAAATEQQLSGDAEAAGLGHVRPRLYALHGSCVPKGQCELECLNIGGHRALMNSLAWSRRQPMINRWYPPLFTAYKRRAVVLLERGIL